MTPRSEKSSLDAAVDNWTLQAVSAGRYLLGLYRRLGDGRQVDAAFRAMTPSVERMERLRLQSELPIREAAFLRDHPDETNAEEAAWRDLLNALAGLQGFFALVDDKPGIGLRGPHNATRKAFAKAVQGFRTAFPATMTDPGTEEAIEAAIRSCTATLLDQSDLNSPEQEGLRLELEAVVRQAISNPRA